MTNLQRKAPKGQHPAAVAASIKEAESAGYEVKPCYLCEAPVIWASTGQKLSGHRHPISVEVVELGHGTIALQRELAFGGTGPKPSPQAYETSTATRFAWHAPRCTGPGRRGKR